MRVKRFLAILATLSSLTLAVAAFKEGLVPYGWGLFGGGLSFLAMAFEPA